MSSTMKSLRVNIKNNKRRETVPLYERVIVDLKKEIDEGIYKVGDLLPSENELCASYNTTRRTVREALLRLINMGYIIRYKGKGSIVAEPKRALGILSVSGVTAGVRPEKLKTSILQKPIARQWPIELLPELNEIELAAGCIYFTRLRIISNRPVLFEETFISNLGMQNLTKTNLDNRSLFKTLNEQYNIEIKGGMQRIWAKKADKPISELLKIKRNSPIVYMKRKMHTNIKDLNIYAWLSCDTQDYYLEDYF